MDLLAHLLERIKLKISKIFYNHGLFIATHPVQVLTVVCTIIILLCYPITQLPMVREVPTHHIILEEDHFQSLKQSELFTLNQNKSLGFMLQIVLHLPVNTSQSKCSVDHDSLSSILQLTVDVVEWIGQFRSSGDATYKSGRSYNDVCFQVEDRVVAENERPNDIRNVLPTFGCLILSPSLLLDMEERGSFKNYQTSLFSRIRLAASRNLRDLLFGFPWKLTGLSQLFSCSRTRNAALAVTLVFREYDPVFLLELRSFLVSRFQNSMSKNKRFGGKNADIPESENGNVKDATINNNNNNNDNHSNKSAAITHTNFTSTIINNHTISHGHLLLVWYRDRSYFSDYSPLIVIYVILLLYVYFSVRKLEMVKSKWGLALSACVTVAASLFMSIGLCITIGLMVPTLNGSEVFPYLVVLIGFENVIVLTKSVVATPVDLPVKYRIAEGLSKESWSLTKLYLTGLLLLGLGFLTFHPTMQEFCLFAVVGMTTDFFLQFFFFITILSVDIRRMELSDLYLHCPTNSILQNASILSPLYSNSLFEAMSQINNELPTDSSKTKTPTIVSDIQSNLHQFERNKHVNNFNLSFLQMFSTKLVKPYAMAFKYIPFVTNMFKSQFIARHKRKVSAAEAAAYLASDCKTPIHFPRRIRFLRYWAKLRLIQRFMMVVFTIWIIVFFIHAVDIYQMFVNFMIHLQLFVSYAKIGQWKSAPTTPSLYQSLVNEDASSPFFPSVGPSTNELINHSIQLNKAHVNNADPIEQSVIDLYSNESITIDDLLFHDTSTSDVIHSAAVRIEENANYKLYQKEIIERILSSDYLDERQIDLFKWDTLLMWNYLAFYHWPLLANFYNLSLADHCLAFLQPIHLKQDAEPQTTTNVYADNARPATLTHSIHSMDEMSPINDCGSLPKKDHTLFQSIKNSFPIWTTRLGLTATMIGTSVVGCSLILLVTCVGMVCLQSRLSTTHKHEPIIRVLPLTISLTNSDSKSSHLSSSSSELSSNSLFSPEWTVAFGRLLHSTNPIDKISGLNCSSVLLAVTSVRSFNQFSRCYSAIIRLWCADSGNELTPLERYSSSSINKRRSISEGVQRSLRRFTSVWCMKFMPQGLLLVGCSDGTVEVWDCELAQLVDILNVRENDYSASSETQESECDGSKLTRVGGITLIDVIDETSFCAGTSYGYIVYFAGKYNARTTNFEHTFPMYQKNVHSRAVTQLRSIRYSHTSEDAIIINNPPNNSDILIISGSEDGRIVFLSPTSDELITYWLMDPTPVICLTVKHLMVAVSHASGYLYVNSFELRLNSLELLNDNSNSVGNIPNFKSKLQVTVVEHLILSTGCCTSVAPTSSNAHIHSSSTKRRPIDAATTKHIGALELQLLAYPNKFCSSEQSTKTRDYHLFKNYRLVSHDLDGNVTVWNLATKSTVRSFRANMSSFHFSNSMLSFGGRVVFGDQCYLRVVNPWTAKYERSVQLLPPSSKTLRGGCQIPLTKLSTLLRHWSKELVPVGAAFGEFYHDEDRTTYMRFGDLLIPTTSPMKLVNFDAGHLSTQTKLSTGSYVVSLAESGNTLVIIPFSVLRMD